MNPFIIMMILMIMIAIMQIVLTIKKKTTIIIHVGGWIITIMLSITIIFQVILINNYEQMTDELINMLKRETKKYDDTTRHNDNNESINIRCTSTWYNDDDICNINNNIYDNIHVGIIDHTLQQNK